MLSLEVHHNLSLPLTSSDTFPSIPSYIFHPRVLLYFKHTRFIYLYLHIFSHFVSSILFSELSAWPFFLLFFFIMQLPCEETSNFSSAHYSLCSVASVSLCFMWIKCSLVWLRDPRFIHLCIQHLMPNFVQALCRSEDGSS